MCDLFMTHFNVSSAPLLIQSKRNRIEMTLITMLQIPVRIKIYIWLPNIISYGSFNSLKTKKDHRLNANDHRKASLNHTEHTFSMAVDSLSETVNGGIYLKAAVVIKINLINL